jgi:galactose mutarotase-like enzyme
MVDTVPYLGAQLRRWQVGSSTFVACPERGARLMYWHLTQPDGSERSVIHWPELVSLDDFAKVRGGNPVLFPFSARTFDQGDMGFWRASDSVRRPMPMHGFARQGAFRLERADATGFAATLIPDERARECYPYDYEFTVVYRFRPRGLTCEFVLRNHDTRPIPWSAGHHFYFTAPWVAAHNRADCLLRIPARRHLRQDPRGQLVPAPAVPPNPSLGTAELIDTFHLGLTDNIATLSARDGIGGTLQVRIGTDRVPPPEATFVTWTGDATAPYYCIEPWMSPPNAPETKLGLQLVPPARSHSFVVEVELI